MYRPINIRGKRPVIISSNLPDKVMQKSLKLFLEKERSEMKDSDIDKEKQSNTFIEWCNSGLLQFIDLQTWALMENVKITNKALAYGIFPDNAEKGEENIRKTTRRHADIIFGTGNNQGISMSMLFAYSRLDDFEEGN